MSSKLISRCQERRPRDTEYGRRGGAGVCYVNGTVCVDIYPLESPVVRFTYRLPTRAVYTTVFCTQFRFEINIRTLYTHFCLYWGIRHGNIKCVKRDTRNTPCYVSPIYFSVVLSVSVLPILLLFATVWRVPDRDRYFVDRRLYGEYGKPSRPLAALQRFDGRWKPKKGIEE